MLASYNRRTSLSSRLSPMPDPPHIETPELLCRARAGDRDSLEQLIRRYRPELLTRIRLMMGDGARRAAESGDFLQGALVEVMEDLSRYELEDEAAFLRWATRIARNNIRDQVRRGREKALESFVSGSGLFRPADAAVEETPSHLVLHAEQQEILVEALAQLREEYQRVVELHWFEGLTFAEIGLRLDRSEEAARMLHARALVRLGDELKRNGVG